RFPNKIMKNFKNGIFQMFALAAAAIFVFSTAAFAQQTQIQRSTFDVTNYRMDVSLVPNENKLNATVDVDFVPQEDTRSVAFELNGSLKIDSITRVNATTPITSTTTPSKVKTPTNSTTTSPQNQVT